MADDVLTRSQRERIAEKQRVRVEWAERDLARKLRKLRKELGPAGDLDGDLDAAAERVLSVLRLAATGEAAVPAPVVSAAKDWLAHYRWIQEQKRGRAPQRGKLQAGVAVVIVDSISDPAAGDVEPSSDLELADEQPATDPPDEA